MQIDPATVKGQAEGELTLDLKLGKTAKPEDSQFHATGALSNLTLDKFVGPEKLDQGSLTFVADRNTLTMSGDGQLFGSPAHIDASRAPGDDGLGDRDRDARSGGARQARAQSRLAHRAAADQAQGAALARQRRRRGRPDAGRRRQSDSGRREGGRQAGQGDVPDQAVGRGRVGEQPRRRLRNRLHPRFGGARRRRRDPDGEDHSGAPLARRQPAGRRDEHGQRRQGDRPRVHARRVAVPQGACASSAVVGVRAGRQGLRPRHEGRNRDRREQAGDRRTGAQPFAARAATTA